MNKICKIYTSEIKSFFPVFGKNEKAYFSKLTSNVDDFCNEEDINTKEDLYVQYGLPIDIVRNYYSFVGMDSMIRRIRLRNSINRIVIIMLLLSVVLVSLYCGKFYN